MWINSELSPLTSFQLGYFPYINYLAIYQCVSSMWRVSHRYIGQVQYRMASMSSRRLDRGTGPWYYETRPSSVDKSLTVKWTLDTASYWPGIQFS